jgi:hypothetical protein
MHAFYLSPEEQRQAISESENSLGPQSEYQDSQSFTEKPWLKKKNQTKPKDVEKEKRRKRSRQCLWPPPYTCTHTHICTALMYSQHSCLS